MGAQYASVANPRGTDSETSHVVASAQHGVQLHLQTSPLVLAGLALHPCLLVWADLGQSFENAASLPGQKCGQLHSRFTLLRGTSRTQGALNKGETVAESGRHSRKKMLPKTLLKYRGK